ncbi:acyltransferase family protein [Microbacterium aerolatum]|uniref:Acyltransferase n=1 Tax=Microbacterium aerolatum TaxID=153731 RepID=A0A511AHN1_9MICO|nr:acyltransferase family protein [Microbacterium aerolatum]GEK86221.1 acyltransferase [Microbacterium aerolatum]GGB16238.1 acyltransferase [Microbacterium aerolatum]
MTGASGTTTNARGFRSDIQGLRAIAVIAVVVYHAGVPFLSGGYVGVDVFFVISGFLITTHLLEGLERDGHVRFASFYAKRARRILPAAFLVLVLTVVAAVAWMPPLMMKELWRGAVATALYVPNLLFALDGTKYLAEEAPSMFQHYWSLGIEEQFYLIWPLLLALGWRWVRSRRALFTLLLALVVVSFATGVVLTFWVQPYAFFLLPTRAWELGIGGIIAFLLLRRPQFVPTKVASLVGWIGMAAMIVPVFLFTSATPFPGYWAAVPVVGTALVILAGATSSRFAPTRVLSGRVMLFLGGISYSLYLVHWPALRIPQASVGYADPLPLWATLGLAALCIPAAWLMYRYVEDPARKASWLTRFRPRRSLLAAVAGSVASIAVATAALAYSDARPLDAGQPAAATVLETPPVVTPFVPSNLIPTLDTVQYDLPDISGDGCHQDVGGVALPPCLYGTEGGPRVVLFGDSHGAQWAPALRAAGEAEGYQVEIRTKNSCPSISASAIKDGVPFIECEQWRDAVIKHLNDDPPALVVLTNFSSNELAGDSATTWQAGLNEMIVKIEAPVAVIADTPDLRATPAVCLSGRLHDAEACGLPRDAALQSPTRAATADAAQGAGVPYLDFTDYFCSASRCEPIIGSTLVYRDAHHITATFSEKLGPPLATRLAEVLR